MPAPTAAIFVSEVAQELDRAGHPLAKRSDVIDGHAGTIEDAKDMVNDRISNRGAFAPPPSKAPGKSPSTFDTSGRYFESKDGWRFHWTTAKDADGYFRAVAIRPTGPGSQAGAKALRKRDSAGEHIP